MTIRESVADRLTGGELSSLREVTQQQANDLWRLQENMQRLEQALYSDEWRRVTMLSDQEFSPAGMRTIMELARIMKLKNPVVGRRVEVQRLYVWAQGVSVMVDDAEIQDVVDGFLDDERNKRALTSHKARGEREEQLQTDANLYFRLFPDATSGRVRVRWLDPMEVDAVICNPEDADEPWFYRRTYTRRELNGETMQITEYYPDWQYHPRSRLSNLSATQLNGRIVWGTPVYHLQVNNGVSELYSSLDWALAYKSFLENLASVWQALARFAWKLTTRGGASGVAAAKTKFGTTLASGEAESNPPPLAGSMFIGAEGAGDLQPFRTSGATMSAEDGRRLMLMAIAAGGYPETFYGDVSVGTLATAESLDRPTELKIRDRQSLWADVLRDIVGYALLWAVKAKEGKLRGMGRVEREPDGDEWIEFVVWNEDVNGAVKVEFPPVIDIDVQGSIGALVDATTLKGSAPAGTFDLKTFTAQAARILGLDDVSNLIDELFPEGWDDEEAPQAPSPGMPQQTDDGETSSSEETSSDEEEAEEEAREAVVRAAEKLILDLQEVIRGNGQTV